MTESESLRGATAGEDLFRRDDLRLVLDSIAELVGTGEQRPVASVGQACLDPEHSAALILKIFGEEVSPDRVVLFPTQSSSKIDVTLRFDLDDISLALRADVASGVTRNRKLVDCLGGIPASVIDRIDAARAQPKLASHFISTSADHLTRSLRYRIQDVLLPIAEEGRTITWRGKIEPEAAADFAGKSLFPFATTIMIEIPDFLLESANAE